MVKNFTLEITVFGDMAKPEYNGMGLDFHDDSNFMKEGDPEEKILDFTNSQYGSVSLENADFSGLNLSGANFTGKSLKGSRFANAVLKDAVFCTIKGNKLSEQDVQKLSGEVQTDLSGLDFENVNFGKANLKGVSFRNAYLAGADLRGADLRYTDFSGSYLKDANFLDAQLEQAKFDGAFINNTNGLNLKDTPSQVLKFSKNSKNVFPVLSCNLTNSATIPLKFCGLNFEKQIYHPGKVVVELLMQKDSKIQEKNTIVAPFQEIVKTFSHCLISVFSEDPKPEDIAYFVQHYHVFKVLPRVEGGLPYLTLEAYSPDVFFTLNKSSHAYLGKKLCTDILQYSYFYSFFPRWTNFSFNINHVAFHPCHLYYAHSTTAQSKEFIHPYLVQYNESFHDFLVRTMNRCGEFLYYEKDKYYVGLPQSPESCKDLKFKKIESVGCSTEEKYKWLKLYEDNYAKFGVDDRNVFSSKVQNPYQDELASNENLVEVLPVNEHSVFEDYIFKPGGLRFDSINDILGARTINDAIDRFIFNDISALTRSSTLMENSRKEYKKEYYESTLKNFEERSKPNGDDMIVYPYSSAHEVDGEPAFSSRYYADILTRMEAVERQRLRITMEACSEVVYLGSLLTLTGFYKGTYVVVKVVGSYYDNSALGEKADACTVEVIPYDSTFVCPPFAGVPLVRRSGVQRAFVKKNAEHSRMGRVQVVFPWQKSDEEGTPWIRVTQPAASSNMGFDFLPQVGDEALVNFEYGNVERPYVEGWVYNGDHSVGMGFWGDKRRSISSTNGQKIVFQDNKNGSDIIASFSPVWGFINSFVPVAKFGLNPTAQRMTGGIDLTDTYGMFAINMSSDKRSVTISSPLGTVTYNAFTGIVINAPNGKVQITGKNIDIWAENNLTMMSGQNLAHYFEGQKSKWKEFGIKLSAHFIPIDLTFVRTLIETVVRPVGGAMRIHSNRNLCIEGGKGKAAIIGRERIKNSTSLEAMKKTARESMFLTKGRTYSVVSVHHMLQKLVAFLVDYKKKQIQAYKEAQEAKETFKTKMVVENDDETLQLSSFMTKSATTLVNYGLEGHKFESAPHTHKNNHIFQQYFKYNKYGGALVKAAKEAQPQTVFKKCLDSLSDSYYDGALQRFLETKKTEITAEGAKLEIATLRNQEGVGVSNQQLYKWMIAFYREIIDNQAEDEFFQFKKPAEAPANLGGDGVLNNWVTDNVDKEDEVKAALPDQRSKHARNALQVFGLEGFQDQYAWNRTDRGATLMSGQQGSTFVLTGDKFQLQTEDEAGADLFVERVKNVFLKAKWD